MQGASGGGSTVEIGASVLIATLRKSLGACCKWQIPIAHSYRNAATPRRVGSELTAMNRQRNIEGVFGEGWKNVEVGC